MPYKRKWKLNNNPSCHACGEKMVKKQRYFECPYCGAETRPSNPMPQPTDRRQTLIDAINHLPGIQAFSQNNLIRIRCLGCGNRIPFDNGIAVIASSPKAFMEYVVACTHNHICSKQIPPTIETTNSGINWNPPAGAYDPFSGNPSGSYSLTSSGRIRKPLPQNNKPPEPPKPKFSRRFDLDSES